MKSKEEIVKTEDIESLFLIKNRDDFAITLWEILENKFNKDENSLNQVQRNLFLITNLDNASLSYNSGILTFVEEWFPDNHNETINALEEVGAIECSKIIKKLISLLPKNNEWFFDNADEETKNIMWNLNNQFTDYPDGDISELVFNYAKKNKNYL